MVSKWGLAKQEATRSSISQTSGKVLDVGCGELPYIEEITKNGDIRCYVGIDTNEDKLRKARTRIRRASVNVLMADARSLPFVREAYDCCCFLNSYNHLVDRDQIVREMLNVLSTSGRIVLCDHSHDTLFWRLKTGMRTVFSQPRTKARKEDPISLTQSLRRFGFSVRYSYVPERSPIFWLVVGDRRSSDQRAEQAHS